MHQRDAQFVHLGGRGVCPPFALKNGHSRLCFVTSEFHLARVAFFARKLLPEFLIEYVGAPNPPDLDPAAIDKEAETLGGLESGGQWVDVPLPDANYTFPAEIYKNAFEEHKHDDTVSYWIIAGAFSVLIAAQIHGYKSGGGTGASALLIGSAVAGLLAWQLYLRYACFARIARVTMRLIETVYFCPGFSYNHQKYHDNFGLSQMPTSRQVMGILIALLAGLNLYQGIKLLGCVPLP